LSLGIWAGDATIRAGPFDDQHAPVARIGPQCTAEDLDVRKCNETRRDALGAVGRESDSE
jgi:hypothetical protein